MQDILQEWMITMIPILLTVTGFAVGYAAIRHTHKEYLHYKNRDMTMELLLREVDEIC